MLKNAKNIMYRLKNSRYLIRVYIRLKIVLIAKSSTYSVKKYKKTLFLDHFGHICPKLRQSEFSRKIKTPSLNK